MPNICEQISKMTIYVIFNPGKFCLLTKIKKKHVHMVGILYATVHIMQNVIS